MAKKERFALLARPVVGRLASTRFANQILLVTSVTSPHQLNMKLARNVTLFATAVFVFKQYGYLFAAE
jgi:hypothetical protein